MQDEVERMKQENQALSCEIESNRQKVKSLEEELVAERESMEGRRKKEKSKQIQKNCLPDESSCCFKNLTGSDHLVLLHQTRREKKYVRKRKASKTNARCQTLREQ